MACRGSVTGRVTEAIDRDTDWAPRASRGTLCYSRAARFRRDSSRPFRLESFLIIERQTALRAPDGTTWAGWLAGKALPLSICALLVITVGQAILEEAFRLARDGIGVHAALGLVRRCLTLGFVLLIAASYLTRRRVVEPARGFSERIFPVLVLLAGPVGVVFLGRHEMPQRLGLAAAGILISLVGACGSLWALWHLKASFSIMAEARRPVTSGPYRYIRHPLYLGEALMMLGLCITIGTAVALLFWAALNALQLARARIEENKLSRQFEEYRAYCGRTRFILPGLY